MADLSILAISGSLRADSFNTMLLREAAAHVPGGVDVSLCDYREVPLFNSDGATPASVEQFKAQIANADGVLIATPEYNYSIPGVLKNAIDWASRPAYKSVFRDKPTGVVSASMSPVGGARGQQHLKTVLLGMGTPVFPWPELLVGTAGEKFEGGRLVDESSRSRFASYMHGFVDWVRHEATRPKST